MFTSQFDFRRLVLAMITFSWIGTMVTSLPASIMIIDPGTIGGPATNPLLNNVLLTVADPTLDIVFDAMKHVEVTKFGFSALPLVVFEGSFFLTDMNSIEIPGTRLTFSSAALAFKQFSAPVIAHDIHYEFELLQDTSINVILEGRVGVWGANEVPEPASVVVWSVLASVGVACVLISPEVSLRSIVRLISDNPTG